MPTIRDVKKSIPPYLWAVDGEGAAGFLRNQLYLSLAINRTAGNSFSLSMAWFAEADGSSGQDSWKGFPTAWCPSKRDWACSSRIPLPSAQEGTEHQQCQRFASSHLSCCWQRMSPKLSDPFNRRTNPGPTFMAVVTTPPHRRRNGAARSRSAGVSSTSE